MNDKINGATAPLDCTTPLDVLMELHHNASDTAFIEADYLTTAPN